MRLILFLCLVISSCATIKTPEAPQVVPDAEVLASGRMDPVNSRAQIFLEDETCPDQKFYLELRNDKKQKIDVELHYINVLSHQKLPKYKINRISKGRYQVVFEEKITLMDRIDFDVQGYPLRKEIENREKPEPIQGKIVVVNKGDHELTLRLTLKNKHGESLAIKSPPSAVIEGGGGVSELRELQSGLWEFELSLPEENVILYVTIRANGVQLDRLFRYQHVEN